jgi:general secretion pathway protein E
VLYEHTAVESVLMQQFLSRLKVLAHINIAEKRVPQDGKFRVRSKGTPIDLRVSTFPTAHGEKIVVRILDRADNTIDLNSLGFSQPLYAAIHDLINKASGFFLVSGPTGSGKTTTLYSALSTINTQQKNIVTLEDPIEYSISGITQGQIHPDAGFTFEKGIRSVLRQDPDIIMIGEIRDKQTARIAIEAALTGHLVMSTVHTTDAASVVMRLMDMGIEPFLINASVTGVLSQRLARKLCSNCTVEYQPSSVEKAVLQKLSHQPAFLFKSTGCIECLNLGYKGRVGLFELLTMSSTLRSLIVQQPSFDQIFLQARRDGMKLMIEDGMDKVQQGILSLTELLRVIA